MDTFSFFSRFPDGPAADTFSVLFFNLVGLCYSAFGTLGFIINSELRDLRLDPGLFGLGHNSNSRREITSGALPISLVAHINAIEMVFLPRFL